MELKLGTMYINSHLESYYNLINANGSRNFTH